MRPPRGPRPPARQGVAVKVIVVGNFGGQNYQTQIDTLARHFESEGIQVVRTSRHLGKVPRALDVARTLVLPPGGAAGVDAVVAQVHTDWSFAFGLLTVLSGALSGVPAILLYHGSWSRLGSARDLLQRFRPVLAPLFRRAFEVQVASPYLGGLLREIGVGSTVVPHVLDDRWPEGDARTAVRPRILWPRGYHPLYDPHMAVRVFRRVLERRPDARMTMVGQGELREAVQREAEGLPGLAFRDNLPLADLQAAARDHDVYLHTNRMDNQPVSLLEAMSTGMAAVTTNAGGLPYVFAEGEGGFQVEPGDDRAAAARVLDLFEAPGLFARTSRRALDVASRHRWAALRGSWLDLLERARAARRR
jgi:L-malate glycosyltransferase